MFRKLVKAGEIEVDGRGYTLRFYELKTMRGGRRFSCEVQLTAADRIILDDDSMSSLESKSRGWRRRPCTAGCSPRAPRSRHDQQTGDPLRLDSLRVGAEYIAAGQRQGKPERRKNNRPAGGPPRGRRQGPSNVPLRARLYLRGSTASLSCFAMRAFTTVFAGILIASPVAGLRPIRALRF